MNERQENFELIFSFFHSPLITLRFPLFYYSAIAPVFGNPGKTVGGVTVVVPPVTTTEQVAVWPALETYTGYVPAMLNATIKFAPVGFVMFKLGLDHE